MCNLTEHDKGTSAVLPVDRCPRTEGKSLGGKLPEGRKCSPHPHHPTHTKVWFQEDCSLLLNPGGCLWYQEKKTSCWTWAQGHAQEKGGARKRRNTENPDEMAEFVQNFHQIGTLGDLLQSAILYREQNLISYVFNWFISSAIPLFFIL